MCLFGGSELSIKTDSGFEELSREFSFLMSKGLSHDGVLTSEGEWLSDMYTEA